MTKKSIHTVLSMWHKKCDILDIEIIIAHVIKKDRSFVMTHPQHNLSDKTFTKINNFCKKRANHFPLAYIVKSKEFYEREFTVTEHTLIPRPETELMITQIISFIKKNHLSDVCIYDIGTGSGVIAITLALETKKINCTAHIYALDISQQALLVAKANAKKYNLEKDIIFYKSNLLQSAKIRDSLKNKNCKNIIFASNLPYVNTNIKSELLKKPESRALVFEPKIALWSKHDGLLHYEKLIQQSLLLKKKINSFYEIDPKQSTKLQKYIHKNTSSKMPITIHKDLAQKDRILQWSTK